MKTFKYAMAAVALMCNANLSGQGFRVIKTDGSIVTFPAILVDRVEFFPASETGTDYTIVPTVTPPSTNNDKLFLEKTGVEFVNQFQASDFNNLADIVKHIKGYDASELADWAEDCLEDMRTLIGDERTEVERDTSYYYDGYDYEKDEYIYRYYYGTYIYHYADYKWLLRASAFKGHFTVQDNKWVLTPADDLQATFTDRLGNTCVLKLTTSGATKRVHLAKETDRDWHSYSSWYDDLRNYYYQYEMDENTMDVYVDIPEHISLTLTQGSKTLVSTTADFDISQIQVEDWDLARDAISATVRAKVNNYDIIVDRVSYLASEGAHVKLELKKNGNTILLCGADAAGYIDAHYGQQAEVSTSTLGAANVTLNLMGWLQLKADVTDIHSLRKALDNAEDNYRNESEYKRYIDRANRLFDAKFYYRGEEESRGTFALEAFLDYYDSYYEREYWGKKLIVTFEQDGSSYAIDSYFNEDDFRSVINACRDLLDDFDNLMDRTGLRDRNDDDDDYTTRTR